MAKFGLCEDGTRHFCGEPFGFIALMPVQLDSCALYVVLILLC